MEIYQIKIYIFSDQVKYIITFFKGINDKKKYNIKGLHKKIIIAHFHMPKGNFLKEK